MAERVNEEGIVVKYVTVTLSQEEALAGCKKLIRVGTDEFEIDVPPKTGHNNRRPFTQTDEAGSRLILDVHFAVPRVKPAGGAYVPPSQSHVARPIHTRDDDTILADNQRSGFARNSSAPPGSISNYDTGSKTPWVIAVCVLILAGGALGYGLIEGSKDDNSTVVSSQERSKTSISNTSSSSSSSSVPYKTSPIEPAKPKIYDLQLRLKVGDVLSQRNEREFDGPGDLPKEVWISTLRLTSRSRSANGTFRFAMKPVKVITGSDDSATVPSSSAVVRFKPGGLCEVGNSSAGFNYDAWAPETLAIKSMQVGDTATAHEGKIKFLDVEEFHGTVVAKILLTYTKPLDQKLLTKGNAMDSFRVRTALEWIDLSNGIPLRVEVKGYSTTQDGLSVTESFTMRKI